jgi:mono/diheme cytochrome c family protein
LNLGHDLSATYSGNCATCHAGKAMLDPQPPHDIDASRNNCAGCHTLKPKA